MKAKLTFYLPAELKEKIKKLCEEYGVSMSSFIRSLLLLYLSKPIAVAEEVTVFRKRRVLLPLGATLDEKRRKLWIEAQKELKQVLAKRRID